VISTDFCAHAATFAPEIVSTKKLNRILSASGKGACSEGLALPPQSALPETDQPSGGTFLSGVPSRKVDLLIEAWRETPGNWDLG
jgi:hypothetical protein